MSTQFSNLLKKMSASLETLVEVQCFGYETLRDETLPFIKQLTKDEQAEELMLYLTGKVPSAPKDVKFLIKDYRDTCKAHHTFSYTDQEKAKKARKACLDFLEGIEKLESFRPSSANSVPSSQIQPTEIESYLSRP